MVANESGKALERILRYAGIFLALVLLVEVVSMSFPGGTGNGQTGSEPVSEFNASPAELAPLPPLDDFQELVDRSLFAWNRQPITPGKKAGDEEEIDIAEWHLSGVVSHPRRNSLAIFVATEGDQSLALEKGMYLGNWKIERIDEDSVMILNGDEEQVMQMQTIDSESPQDSAAGQGETPDGKESNTASRDAKTSSAPAEGGGKPTPTKQALKKASGK